MTKIKGTLFFVYLLYQNYQKNTFVCLKVIKDDNEKILMQLLKN